MFNLQVYVPNHLDLTGETNVPEVWDLMNSHPPSSGQRYYIINVCNNMYAMKSSVYYWYRIL